MAPQGQDVETGRQLHWLKTQLTFLSNGECTFPLRSEPIRWGIPASITCLLPWAGGRLGTANPQLHCRGSGQGCYERGGGARKAGT